LNLGKTRKGVWRKERGRKKREKYHREVQLGFKREGDEKDRE